MLAEEAREVDRIQEQWPRLVPAKFIPQSRWPSDRKTLHTW